MTKVVAIMSMSLDGTSPTSANVVAEVFDWYVKSISEGRTP